MTTLAYVYKWTHLPTLKWYIGSRTGKGCHPGRKMSSSSVEKLAKSISIATKGKPKTEAFKEKLRKPKKENHKLAISKALTGKTRSEIHSQNLSRAIKNSKASCIICGLTSTKSAITRYHNNNCRKKNENN